jgi:hypothetical protein
MPVGEGSWTAWIIQQKKETILESTWCGLAGSLMIHCPSRLPADSRRPVRLAGAGLFREKSTAGWLRVAGLFCEKKYCCLVADKRSEQGASVFNFGCLMRSTILTIQGSK